MKSTKLSMAYGKKRPAPPLKKRPMYHGKRPRMSLPMMSQEQYAQDSKVKTPAKATKRKPDLADLYKD